MHYFGSCISLKQVNLRDDGLVFSLGLDLNARFEWVGRLTGYGREFHFVAFPDSSPSSHLPLTSRRWLWVCLSNSGHRPHLPLTSAPSRLFN